MDSCCTITATDAGHSSPRFELEQLFKILVCWPLCQAFKTQKVSWLRNRSCVEISRPKMGSVSIDRQLRSKLNVEGQHRCIGTRESWIFLHNWDINAQTLQIFSVQTQKEGKKRMRVLYFTFSQLTLHVSFLYEVRNRNALKSRLSNQVVGEEMPKG